MAVKIDAEKCDACRSCVDACPVQAIKLEGKAVVNADECIECGACVDECPNEAIAL